MKTKIIPAFVLAVSGFAPGIFGQAPTPATPAPTVTASTNAAPAENDNAAAPAPNQVIYSPRLPTAQELTNAAAAQGATVTKIEQSGSQVVATYRTPNGQTNIVSYQLLPAAGTSGSAAVVTSPPPAVVYSTAPRVVYYDPPGYYEPWYWYPPVSLSFGFGFHNGYYRGYPHGGFYHGGGYHGGGYHGGGGHGGSHGGHR